MKSEWKIEVVGYASKSYDLRSRVEVKRCGMMAMRSGLLGDDRDA